MKTLHPEANQAPRASVKPAHLRCNLDRMTTEEIVRQIRRLSLVRVFRTDNYGRIADFLGDLLENELDRRLA